MHRWQEQVEIKLAELLRTSSSFRAMGEVWAKLAHHQDPGYAAYAKQKAAMYEQMAGYCKDGLDREGYGGFRSSISCGKSLLDLVESRRQAEARVIRGRA